MLPGRYDVPVQGVSLVLLGPGSTVSHDAMRLLSNYGTGLAIIGEDGVRFYSAMLSGRDESELARRQARVWSDDDSRTMIARRLYAWRFGEVLPHDDLDVLRGIEGDRMKAAYARIAAEYGVAWRGRRYDRTNPAAADIPNQAINHAATAVEAIAAVAVNAVSAIPQLGFIHEHSAQAFVLDIADLFRNEVTLPIAFSGALEITKGSQYSIDRIVRKCAGRMFRERNVAGLMIEKIKELFDVGHDGGHHKRRS
jgi:CRISPR-associated protein Cas1